jgi:hypothetical protein
MSEVTRILSAIEEGDSTAANQLLPLVYDELRQLAAQRLAQEKPGQTLQATALVHEAYVRLVDTDKAQNWNSRGHFFAAASARLGSLSSARMAICTSLALRTIPSCATTALRGPSSTLSSRPEAAA